ncbi:MAG: DAK2 domain-containing protein [Clostridia bacterium]|nr:DAK2 domain-containing protein [Clostridia bacterium]
MNGQNTFIIDGSIYAKMVKSGAGLLGRYRTKVNDLNVFPVPDGDTGDNMYMTIGSGAESIELPSANLAEDSATIARNMLLGARGNSGVILSRIFAGISKGLVGADKADVATFGKALTIGVEEAYKAVSVPVEGTILTVYRDAVNMANSRINDDSSFESYFTDFLAELKSSLARTPELLAVLREAGVVDSGGAGFVYIAEGMQRALNGENIESDDKNGAPSKPSHADFSLFTEDSVLTYGYCTEFLLRLQNSKIPGGVESFDETELFDFINSAGDSVVAFREGSIVKIHVHTEHPGDVLNFCQKYGEFLTLKIENMTVQHNETLENSQKSVSDGDIVPEKVRVHKKYGTVAVAAGSGLTSLFAELGTDEVVNGGQSMNPSAEDFIKAFDNVNADVIYVFPNNGNIVLTAKQAASLYDKSDIRVIPTKSIGQGYAAISMFDSGSDDPDEIESSLIEAFDGVLTGTVSKAGRDTEMNGVSVKNGDYIGYEKDDIFSDSPDKNEAALVLAEKLEAGDHDVLLVIKGADTTADEADELCEKLASRFRRTEVIPADGGQPVYNYLMILM